MAAMSCGSSLIDPPLRRACDWGSRDRGAGLHSRLGGYRGTNGGGREGGGGGGGGDERSRED